MKKLAEWIVLLCFLPFFWFFLVGCTDDNSNNIETLELDVMAPSMTSRVVAKDYHVLAASREARQCRYQPEKNAGALLLLQVGQKVSLLSVEEKGRRVAGDLWLHVYVDSQQRDECFVLAGVLAPVASTPVIK